MLSVANFIAPEYSSRWCVNLLMDFNYTNTGICIQRRLSEGGRFPPKIRRLDEAEASLNP
jgi:hypothetical protein